MSFRFWRSFRIAPGVSLNVSKGGVSLTVGPPGAKVTAGTHGTRATVGLPGTGLRYTTRLDAPPPRTRTPRERRSVTSAPPASLPPQLATLAGALELVRRRRETEALEELRTIAHLPDAAFLGGLLALRQGDHLADEARALLSHAVRSANELGSALEALGESVSVDLPLTPDLRVVLCPDRRGAVLALVEALQRLGRVREGVEALQGLLRERPDDALVRMSLEDLLGGS